MLKHFCQDMLPGGRALTFDQAATIARKTGYDSIEIHIGEIVQVVAERSHQYVMEQYGKFGVLPATWHVQFQRKDAWRMDDELYQQGLKALPHYAEVASRIGCRRAFTWLPSYSNDRDFKENFAWHVKRLKPMAKILGDHGCVFGLEWQGPKTLRTKARYEFVHTQQGLQELIYAIDEKNVGFLLDTWHWHTARGTLQDIRALSASQVVLIHISDAPAGVPIDELQDLVREVPGRTGIIDLVGFLKALKETGYQGPVEPGVVGCPYIDAMSTEEAARTNCQALVRLFQKASIT